jgi:pimeloyl-ACP methyl ester carboxylesterase
MPKLAKRLGPEHGRSQPAYSNSAAHRARRSWRVPTLVLQGEFDAITPPGSGRLAASRLRRGYYIEFAQVGHKMVDQSVCGQKIAAVFVERPNQTPLHPCLREKPQRPW